MASLSELLFKLAFPNPLLVTNNGPMTPPNTVGSPDRQSDRAMQLDRMANPSRYRFDKKNPRNLHDPTSWLRKKSK